MQADLRIERFAASGWALCCYVATVALARELTDRFARVGSPTRYIDDEGTELYRRVHSSDINSYAEG